MKKHEAELIKSLCDMIVDLEQKKDFAETKLQLEADRLNKLLEVLDATYDEKLRSIVISKSTTPAAYRIIIENNLKKRDGDYKGY